MSIATSLPNEAINCDKVDTQPIDMSEFEFVTDLAIELPVDVNPKQFFDYLVRVMIAHTEAYGGYLGGATKWHPLEQVLDE